ncbi:YdiK family protein [Alkalicoccus saliphilus]|jgi:hypothetical protein|uniref:DUF4305 domain-containing protein n=1 Tax=Alkalicoccus saliphilus TaxID=200989 RepID=A0A2T4U2N5_9BACI|nr:YdiK family protein [Alkalicoccus saliphilus]PTL37658.1 DUF4305 domain-containing protein [Alkalicoccus saliphilus]
MMRSPRFNGYLFFFVGTLFLMMAIQTAGQTSGWDILTIVLIAFAAFDYMLAFKFFGIAGRQANSNNKGK